MDARVAAAVSFPPEMKAFSAPQGTKRGDIVAPSTNQFLSRGFTAVAAGTLAVASLALPPASAQNAAGAPAGSVLTVTIGPRQGTWTRAFNPFRTDADSRWPTWAGVYEPLVICNRATGAFAPWLATSYEWSADNLVLRFIVRGGVRWSDGTPFSARDVAFTFDLMRRYPALDHDGVWQFLSEVTAPDVNTVEFRLKRAYTPGALYIGEQAIVPEHKWKDVAQPATFDDPTPVGTGPFVEVRRFTPTLYELGRNKAYWQPGKPTVDVLRVPLYRSNDEITRALAADQVDWASLFFPDIEKDWVAKDPAHHQYWYPDTGPTVLLELNTRQKPFDDRTVRKALSMAIDRARITREALNGYPLPADATGLAESQKRWKDTALAQEAWGRHDVAAANRLLDAALLARDADGTRAVPGGGAMRYTLLVVQGWTDWMAAAEIMRQNLAEIGVAVTVKTLDYNAWDDAQRRGKFELSMGFGSRGPTPYEFYRGQMDSAMVRPVGERAEANVHRFGDAEATQILRRLEATSNPVETSKLIVDLQRRFVQEAPSIPLFIGPQWGVFNTIRLAGFPSRFRPYASAAPTGSPRGAYPAPDSLPVLLEVKPR
jgi:peptide/nickel transport system substrate-binding protein